jgi:protein MpaA
MQFGGSVTIKKMLSAAIALLMGSWLALDARSASARTFEWQLLSLPHPEKAHRMALDQLCSDIEAIYQKNRWGASKCWDIPFEVYGFSVQQRPLVYIEAGKKDSPKTSLIQCGIHGDELPGLPMCMNLIHEILSGVRLPPKETRLLIQPLLNPDGMFAKSPTRANANGVDINRNFPTEDFDKQSLASWKRREHSDPRKYPGEKANSEPETQAIVRFMDEQKPQKILAIHTPLGFLDLDSKGQKDQERRARYLAVNMSKNSGNYKFITFGFYPGSMGNFAGRERQVPVYTLELPPGNSKPTVDNYWKRFRVALWRAVDFDLDTGQFMNED